MSGPDEKRRAVESHEDWEKILSAAAQLQEFIPDAVLVGGTAAAVHADHRFSHDDDHVVVNLAARHEHILETLEAQAVGKRSVSSRRSSFWVPPAFQSMAGLENRSERGQTLGRRYLEGIRISNVTDNRASRGAQR
jgi:hypothetical protein